MVAITIALKHDQLFYHLSQFLVVRIYERVSRAVLAGLAFFLFGLWSHGGWMQNSRDTEAAWVSQNVLFMWSFGVGKYHENLV